MAISTYSVTWRLDVKNILDNLADIAGLTPNDGVFIVGDGANWVAESGATVRASLGLGTAAVENIGTSGANVPRLDGTNIWSNKQTLASAQPLFDFDETDGTSTHRISRLTRNGNIFQLHTADSNGIFVSADWRAVVGASGVTSHSWRINNVEKLLLNSTGLTVTNALTVNGSGNLGNISGLTLASGDIIYANATPALTNLAKGTDGQVLTLASGLPSWADNEGASWTYATPQATTSGTAFDFTGIPTGTSEIEVTGIGNSISGTDNLLVQLGDAGGIETTGYNAGNQRGAVLFTTNGFPIYGGNSTELIQFSIRLMRVDSAGTIWSCLGQTLRMSSQITHLNGNKTLSAELTQVRLTRSGTDTFDAGNVYLRYR